MYQSKYKTWLLLVGGAILATAISSCKKLVDIAPPAIYTDGESAYASDGNAIAVLNGIYASMSTSDNGNFNHFMSAFAGLSADEFNLYSGATDGGLIAYYQNELNNTRGPSLWEPTYVYIYRINLAIEGLTASNKLSERVKKQLLGEAKFLRAYNYFYLVNLYGPVPLALGTDYKVNALLSRSKVEDVYQQITSDLLDAENLLSENFVGVNGYSVSSERVVPNRWTAKALLARVRLYTKDYTNAVTSSTEVLNNTSLFKLTGPDSVFLKNSTEALWQLQPINLGWNTDDARKFIIPETGPSDIFPYCLSDDLLATFEPGDKRKTSWVGMVESGGTKYYFPNKYKSATLNAEVTEYQMVFRLAEQYLIRAEANAQLNNLAAAISDVNVIRKRAGLPDYKGPETQTSILEAIVKERRIELFSEWGHRWLDLKRTGTVNQVMSAAAVIKGGSWQSFDQFYPITATELQSAPNVIQNEGY